MAKSENDGNNEQDRIVKDKCADFKEVSKTNSINFTSRTHKQFKAQDSALF